MPDMIKHKFSKNHGLGIWKSSLVVPVFYSGICQVGESETDAFAVVCKFSPLFYIERWKILNQINTLTFFCGIYLTLCRINVNLYKSYKAS